jgi:hypothetical protein
MWQGASFMFGIAACTVKQMFMVDRISWLQETACLCACVLLLQNIDSCYLAFPPESRKIRFVGLSPCVWLCMSLHFDRWLIWQILLSSVYEELLYYLFSLKFPNALIWILWNNYYHIPTNALIISFII